jgi:hypothetical protein
MADGQLNATQQLEAAIQAINSGNAKLEWRPVGSGEGSSYAQVLVGNDGQVFEDVQAKDLGGGNVQLVTSAPAGTGGNNPYVGITTSVNPSTGTVAPITSQNQVAIDYNPSKDSSILGLNHNQLMAAGLAAMGGLMYSGVNLGAAGAAEAGTAGAGAGGGGEALSGIDLGGVGASPNTWMGGSTYGVVPTAGTATNLDAYAADNIDVGGGYNPATGTGDAATAAAAAATGVTPSASTPRLFSPSTGAPTTPTTTNPLSNLTPSQIATLAKAGINVAGILAGGAAVGGLMGGGGSFNLPSQNRAGISSGSAQYSPEYYQQLQAKYNQMMPAQPRDVTTELKNWYETKYAPKVI